MKKIYCVIVVYNSDVSKSVAYQNILRSKLSNCYIIIVDNSTNGIDNSIYCSQHQNTYLLQMKQNLGLTKGMNVGIDFVETLNPADSDILVMLNDDTAINKHFFDVLENRISVSDADIFAPIMQGQNGVFYSPCKQGYFKNKYIKSISDTPPQNKFLAIMSGTATTWKIIKDYRFDENIFMDLLDNDFCDFQRSRGRKFEKLDVVIQQNLALKNKNLTFEQIQRRYRIWIPDFLTYCKKKKYRIIGFIPAIAARGVMLSYQCKNIRFWFWAMNYAFNCLRK